MPPSLRPFSRKQLQVLDAPTGRYILLLDGPVRSGKTVPASVRWLRYIAEVPEGTKLLMTGRTRGALKNNVLDDLLGFVGPQGHRWANRQEGELLIWGRRIRCVGAHDERSQDIIQGDTYAGWLADEVVLYPQSFIDQARTRCSMDPGLIVWTCNPEGPFHPIHVEFIDPAAPAIREGLVKRIHFELDDNPGLSPAYKRTLKAGFTGVFYARNVLGLWVMAEGLVYDGFDIEKIGFDDEQAPRRFDRIVVTLDYGTQNPLHALLVGVVGDTSWVLGEWRYCGRDEQAQKTDAQYSADLRVWLDAVGRREQRVIVDPSATSMIAQLRTDQWADVTPARNDVRPGIACVANRLATGKIRIHKSCTHLAREMASYAWDPKAARRGVDEPLKQADHGPDALRYHQFSIFGLAGPDPAMELDMGGKPSTWNL